MDRWRAALRLVGIGWYIAGCIVLGVLAGLWLDDKFDTTPWLTLVGLGAGLGAVFLGIYHMLGPVMEKREREDKDKERK
jgi:F0F1-type ATP synthase assembly protein I